MRKITVLALVVMMVLGISSIFADDNEIVGAGASFPYPLYGKMFADYGKQNGLKVDYQAIGSGGGVRNLMAKTTEFSGTDAYVNDKKLKDAPAEIFHIPTCLGAVAVTYNLPGMPALKLDGETVADIFLGKIDKWNDERIKKLNPDVDLPDMDIFIVHRSDGSGTTFIFSDYLTKISRDWERKVGRGKALAWPKGAGGKGNAGVAQLVKKTEGSIAYVELIYAMGNKLPAAEIKNKSGNFIAPSMEGVSLAADIDMPEDTRVTITNTDAAKGYPISSFTWIIFYKEQKYDGRTMKDAKDLLEMLHWMVNEGQEYPPKLHYAPLPKAAVEKANQILKKATYDGKPIL